MTDSDSPTYGLLSDPRNARRPGYSTRAAHAGRSSPLSGTRPTTVPIYAATTFLGEDAEALDRVLAGTQSGYVYGRYGNPTLTALETAISELLDAPANSTIAFSSGMAALHAALLLCELEPGATVLAATDLYGASHTLLATIFGQFDVRVRFADMANLAEVEDALRQQPTPRVVLFEPLSNPLIVSYPLMSSHREWSPPQLRRAGITQGIVRVSVGIEDSDDIVHDIEQALMTVHTRGVAAGSQREEQDQ
jgi:O-acetylhomoserine/O-acetylserine sulfhydrylase-like pyridoxal-dependent enzyme